MTLVTKSDAKQSLRFLAHSYTCGDVSQQHACVSQGQICSENFPRYHTEIWTEVADQTYYFIQVQYPNTWLTSFSTYPTTPGAWQGNHWSTDIEVSGMIRPGKIPTGKAGFEPRPATLGADALPPGRRRGPSKLTLRFCEHCQQSQQTC